MYRAGRQQAYQLQPTFWDSVIACSILSYSVRDGDRQEQANHHRLRGNECTENRWRTGTPDVKEDQKKGKKEGRAISKKNTARVLFHFPRLQSSAEIRSCLPPGHGRRGIFGGWWLLSEAVTSSLLARVPH